MEHPFLILALLKHVFLDFTMDTTRGVEAAISSTASTSIDKKRKKRPLTNFFSFCVCVGGWVCSLPSTLYDFEETKIYPYIALTLPTSLGLIVPNYSVSFS